MREKEEQLKRRGTTRRGEGIRVKENDIEGAVILNIIAHMFLLRNDDIGGRGCFSPGEGYMTLLPVQEKPLYFINSKEPGNDRKNMGSYQSTVLPPRRQGSRAGSSGSLPTRMAAGSAAKGHCPPLHARLRARTPSPATWMGAQAVSGQAPIRWSIRSARKRSSR